MASEASLSDSVDPLRGISGPLLFPRTIRPSVDVPVPVDPKDLDSIHNFMKSLELRSPEKLMNEAKRIVDGGAEFLESKLGSFAENVGITDANAAKGKDRPQERRPGLRLDRKRATFSLRTSVSQPSVSLEPTLNIDQLHDPDEFFDAYERMENAKKEIQKQLGGSIDNVNLYEPSNTARRRRPGILGKSYNYKHRYSSEPSENDMLMASQKAVDQDIPSAPEDELQEKLVHPDPNPDADLAEVEPAVSTKKTDNEVSDILEELLSCNNEDLEGDGALNILQEKLKIKPLDLGNLYITEIPDDGRTSISTVTASLQKPCRSSLVIDSVLKNLTMKSPVADPVKPVSSPTPPRSPFASLSLLQKRILQPNPLRDPFSPTHVDLSACQNAFPGPSKDKLLDQVDVPKILGMSNQLESCIEVDNAEPTVSNTDAEKVMEDADSLPEQFAYENAGVQSSNADSRTHEESGNNIEETMNNDANGSKPSELEDEARDDTSSRRPNDPEQQPEVHQAKLPRGKRVAGEKRIRKAHPMRKSLAESGTSFEAGVRRSKRIKSRPLEYWKGERFLYGRVDNSLKLIGVKYLSPGKDTDNLKVKPYIASQSSEYQELLELAARH
ncbi:uncharacterized protein LOC105157576 isoform X2 [Sesamum indicum]|uniref:Uncharacterized protein LOC105157576 isoform X2 n=1 Tax=Sesamum indicum TaxID=4182 RepID=A0A6I9SXE7_SESIN|nr:uncharacterized protein LOC105157576 isoform X2 [Sesamum indicum]